MNELKEYISTDINAEAEETHELFQSLAVDLNTSGYVSELDTEFMEYVNEAQQQFIADTENFVNGVLPSLITTDELLKG